MHGGVSHVDSFDPKPELIARNGQPLPFPKPKFEFAPTGNLLASPWKFRPYGESGAPDAAAPAVTGNPAKHALNTLREAARHMIASVAVDYHVTQVVDGTKGIHGMIPKSIFK